MEAPQPPGSQDEVAGDELVLTRQYDAEIGIVVTIYVGGDDGVAIVVAEMQFARRSGEPVAADEGKGLIIGEACMGIDPGKVDFVALGMAEIDDHVRHGG